MHGRTELLRPMEIWQPQLLLLFALLLKYKSFHLFSFKEVLARALLGGRYLPTGGGVAISLCLFQPILPRDSAAFPPAYKARWLFFFRGLRLSWGSISPFPASAPTGQLATFFSSPAQPPALLNNALVLAQFMGLVIILVVFPSNCNVYIFKAWVDFEQALYPFIIIEMRDVAKFVSAIFQFWQFHYFNFICVWLDTLHILVT